MTKISFKFVIPCNKLQLSFWLILGTYAVNKDYIFAYSYSKTRMWADDQRDGRPAEYRWRHLRKFCNSIPCTTPQTFDDDARVPCSNAANIGERKS